MHGANSGTRTNGDGFSRRQFLKMSAALPLVSGSAFLAADPLGVPIGLQLYTVGKEADADPAGTLKRVAAAGYKAVEGSPMSKVPPAEFRKMLDDAGLKMPSSHYLLPDLLGKLPEKIDGAHALGLEYMVVTVPWVADASRLKAGTGTEPGAGFLTLLNGLTLDDWKWNAEQFNRVGEQVKKAGLQLAYHNHNFEFRPLGTVTGYDEFLRLTDPELVKLEMDCGWMAVAGQDPAAYLAKYPERYRMLHIKDFKKGFAPSTTLGDKSPGAAVPTELGRGVLDYSHVLSAARKGTIRALFVEQEPPFTEMPALEAIKVDYDYLKDLRV